MFWLFLLLTIVSITFRLGISNKSNKDLSNFVEKSEAWEAHPDFFLIESEYANYAVPASKSKVLGVPSAVIAKNLRHLFCHKIGDANGHYSVSQTTPEEARIFYLQEQQPEEILPYLSKFNERTTDAEIADMFDHCKRKPSSEKQAFDSVRLVVKYGNKEDMIRRMQVGMMGQTGSLRYAKLIIPLLFVRNFWFLFLFITAFFYFIKSV